MERRNLNPSHADAPVHSLETLERRALLAMTPLPQLSDLQDPNDSVIRIETPLGAVYVELFDSASPTAVGAFADRIGRGDLDLSFFHRLVPGDVLAGGEFKFDPGAGLYHIPDGGPLAPEGAAPNAARTLALAATTGGASSAHFYFNLADHLALGEPTPITIVIGRVATDASWAVVQRIAGLHTADLDVRLTGSEGSTFDNVPVIGGDGDDNDDDGSDGLRKDDGHENGDDGDHDDGDDDDGSLVGVTDIEVVKAGGNHPFYTHSLSYPEGFSGSTVDEFVPIGNPNDQEALYQVILRFEPDPAHPFARRDAVIAVRTIAPHSRDGITVWRGATDTPANTPDSLIAVGRPYAIEVRSTVAVAATLSHYDFGLATGESFTGAPSTDWAVTGGVKESGCFDFLVWYNPTARDARVAITFTPEGQAPRDPVFVTVGAFRRGGLSVPQMDIVPTGHFAARIVADQPLVAAISHYQPGEAGQGFTSIAAGDASDAGAVPLATFGAGPQGGTVTLSFLDPDDDELSRHVTICHIPPGNPGNAHTITIGRPALRAHLAHGDDDHDDDDHAGGGGQTAVISLSLHFENPSIADVSLSAILTLQPGRSGSVRLDSPVLDIAQYRGQRFTVRFTSTAPVFSGMVQSDDFDGTSTAVGVSAATDSQFGEGFMDPARAGTEVFETVAVYNPSGSSAAAVNLIFRYTDGAVVTVARTVTAGGTLFLDLHTLQEILDQGNLNHRYFYSIDVLSDVAVVTQLTHLDTNLGLAGHRAGGFSTLGAPMSAFGPLPGTPT